MNIAFYPVFDDIEKLRSYMFRATWYLKPLRKHIKSIDFFVNFDTSLEQVVSKNIEYLDSSIANSLKNFSEVSIKKCTSVSGEILKNYSFVLVHDEPSRNKLIKIKQDNKLNFDIVRVDHENVQYADSFFLRFAEKISGLHDEFRRKSKNKIEHYLPELKTEKIYLFGTGPNFSYVDNVDFSDGLVIACNSMVVNKEIINKLNPQLFVIADPIFHAGPSSYAESFRESLINVLGEKKHPIVVPLRDYHIYLEYFPVKILERLIPIEFKKLEDEKIQNLDIIKNNYVTTTSNILTLFQLPLASTLSNKIYISGCDGRPLSQNNYFWSHNKSVQINDKMTDIQYAHPSFFDISYDDYYSSHIETLEKWCKNIENNGQKIFNLTPSYIPALQKRTTDLIIGQVLEKDATVDLSIIIPLYNAEEFLNRTINSILSNGFTGNFEILLIDDFSEDNSLKLAKDYAEKYKNIKVVQNFYSKGVSGARNTGIKLANGKAICFLDADDFVYPKSLDKRYKILMGSSNIKIVHSTVKFVDDKDNYLGVEICTRRKVTFADCTGNPIHFNTLMLKKEIAKHLHFDETLTNGEDWLAFSKLMRFGYYSEYVPEASAAYRIHRNSTVLKNFDKHEEKLVGVIDWLYKDVDSSEASKNNLKALSKGSKQGILASRRFNQFVMNVLKTDNFKPSVFLNDRGVLSVVEDEKQNFDNRLKVALLRAFSLHIDNMHFISMMDKKRIRKNIENIEALIGKNPFCNYLKSKLKVNETMISIEKANAYFKTGNIKNAREIYRQLTIKDEFYNFLYFNMKKIDGFSIRNTKELNIAVLTNCQGGPIKGLIKKHLPQVTFQEIEPVHLIPKTSYKNIFKKLANSDLIIAQPLSESFAELSFINISKFFNKKLITIPNIYFAGFNPELFYFKNIDGSANREFIIDYHDIFVLYGYLKKKSIDEVNSWFYNKEFIEKNFFKDLYQDSLSKLENNEEITTLSISDTVTKTINKSFYTINHPSNPMIDGLSKRILRYIGYTGKFDGAKSRLFANIQIPSYTYVCNYLNIPFIEDYTIDNKKYLKKEMIEKYYKFYDSISVDTLEFNFDRSVKNFKKVLDENK